MKNTLHIVNGDTCIDIMRKSGIEGVFLPWNDFLHQGPVPSHLTLEELSLLRAEFISQFGQNNLKEIKEQFLVRNETLKTYKQYQKIVLWFEHDLYDQLQLIQILSWFKYQNLEKIELSLICTNHYLGELKEREIQKLFTYGLKVLPEHMNLADEAWSAFRERTPKAWSRLLKKSTSLLPFLEGAVLRVLEEYPSTKNGLSRTQEQALVAISKGKEDASEIFLASQKLEERKFMGDAIFWKILYEFEQHKVIKRADRRLSLTPLGHKLLQGEVNWIALKPINHFIGGVELTLENLWCWDKTKKSIEKYYFAKTLNTLLLIK